MENNKIPAKNYRELIVWQDAIKLAKAVYKLTEKFPKQEIYALADQIAVPLFLFPQTLRRDRQEKRQEILEDFYILHLVRWQKWIHSWFWFRSSSTLTKRTLIH